MNMKKKLFLNDYVEIANIHAARLTEALNEVLKFYPTTSSMFANFTKEDIAYLDMLTYRFGKLQDILGTKIFPLILESLSEDALSFIDKLNRLEKLNIIDDANWWVELRITRNQITHDYPNDYELLSDHFNSIIPKIKQLLSSWKNLQLYIAKLP
jgi:hypothetical protein